MLDRVAAAAHRVPGGAAKIRVGRVMAAAVAMARGTPIVTVRLDDGTTMQLDARGRTEAEPAWTGSYDQHTLDVLKSCIPHGGNLLDIGANVGLIAVPMARWLAPNGGRVVAIEPVAANAARLRASAALNGIDVRVIECAVGDATGTITMNRDAVLGAETGNAIMGEAGAGYGVESTVSLRRLDDLSDLPAVDAVKIDIEGAEVLCLRGADAFVVRHRPVILGEFNSDLLPKFGHTFADVQPLLERWSYEVVVWKAANEPLVTTARAGVGNAMLVPRERLETVMNQLRSVPALR